MSERTQSVLENKFSVSDKLSGLSDLRKSGTNQITNESHMYPDSLWQGQL